MFRLLKTVMVTAVCSAVVAIIFISAYILIPAFIAVLIIGVIYLIVSDHYSNG